ncbi:MAG: branched-chain amino acid transaminase [bacterium]
MVEPTGLDRVKWVWMNGEITSFQDARVHILTPGFRYGFGALEGMRAYWNADHRELYIFRVADHFRRLLDSCKIMRLHAGYGLTESLSFLRETIQANQFHEDLHIRQYIYIDGTGGMEATEPTGSFIAAYPRGRTYDLERGVNVCISSWARIDDHSFPPRVKMGSNYQNSRLAKLEANIDGYDDAVMLNSGGKVTEGTGATLFMIRHGQVVVPPVTAGVLEGITRATVMELVSTERRLAVAERTIDRTELYLAEELFFCGTGAEVAPIVTVDRLPIGKGMPGPITCWLRDRYIAIARGEDPAYRQWLTPVYGEE